MPRPRAVSKTWLHCGKRWACLIWAPAIVPVWKDLDPDSEFVARLFDTPLPDGFPYHLLFGYRLDKLFPNESGDGTIALSSQLRAAAQREADFLRGYDQGHVSILDDDALAATLNELLEQ